MKNGNIFDENDDFLEVLLNLDNKYKANEGENENEEELYYSNEELIQKKNVELLYAENYKEKNRNSKIILEEENVNGWTMDGQKFQIKLK